MHDDLFERLEHDHAPMAAVLLEIRQWFDGPDADGLPALREKLEADPARPRHLLTETGVGYRLVAD